MGNYEIELLTKLDDSNSKEIWLGCSPGWCGPVDYCLPDDRSDDD